MGRLALALPAVLIATLSDLPLAGPALAQEAEKKPPCPVSVPDRATAVVNARLCGGKVEIAGELSEANRVWAEPNGSFTVEQSVGVARFRRDGRWVDVDLTLQRQADGSVAPRAHPLGVVLSGAAVHGTRDLAAMGHGEERIGLQWTGALPEPVLEGAKATYRGIGLGTDLVVRVTPSGFEQLLVVHGRAGLPFVQNIRMGLSPHGPNVEDDGTGGLVFKDAAGTVIGRTPAPQMWDGEKDAISGEPKSVKRIGMNLGAPQPAGVARGLTLAPDTDWLWDPARRFPITIDPYVGQNTGFDTYVNSSYTDDLSTWDKIAIGTTNSGATKRIGFANFTAAGMQGAKFNWANAEAVGAAGQLV